MRMQPANAVYRNPADAMIGGSVGLGGSVLAAGPAAVRRQVRLDSLGLDGLLDRLGPATLVASIRRRLACGSNRHSCRVRGALPLAGA